MLADCGRICALKQVPFENFYLEKESISDGILELISQLSIRKLVMGAGANSKYSRRLTKLSSKKANYVLLRAPEFCHIWFVSKYRLIYKREAVKQPSLDVEGRPSNASVSDNDRHDAGSLSQEFSFGLRSSDFGGYEASSDASSRVGFLLSMCSPEVESGLSSPCLSSLGEIRGSYLELSTLSPTENNFQVSSLPRVPTALQEESGMIHDTYGELDQAMTEAENSNQKAFIESMERGKYEKEALIAAHKVKTAQEFRQTKLMEEELAETKKELEVSRSLLNKFSQELHEALSQKLSLESQLENSYLSEKEMEEKLLSAVDLLQKYKNYHDEMQIERDHALQEVEELRKELAQGPSRSHVAMFSEISFTDIEIATNYFDPSLKIKEGWRGSSYKGFLHQTEVVIKMFNPNSFLGPLKYEQEVKILSKLRHPNLVNIIGACPKSFALVYEYLPNGSLDDRLICKDNTPSLPWQTRIHIATQLCTVLIFLHSNQPSFIHGDLKPSNILLDENFKCKLRGFRECYQTEFLANGKLIEKSDIYSFGVTLLRLLTGKPASGIIKEVERALNKGDLYFILDASAGDWPFLQAEQLVHVALRCCRIDQSNPPDLVSDIWRVLEPMKASSQPLYTFLQASDDRAPHYFMCPIFHETMEDPHIASDGFTYEAEAIRGWLDSGHSTSPMTNVKLTNRNLIPNRALRSAIQELQHHRFKV